MWNMSDIGNNLTFKEVVNAYSTAPDLSTVIEKPADYAGNNLATYIELKAPTDAGYKFVNEWFTVRSQYDPDQRNDETTHVIPDGTYAAGEILKFLKILLMNSCDISLSNMRSKLYRMKPSLI